MKLHLNLTLRRAVLAAMAMVTLHTAQAETTSYGKGTADAYITGTGTLDANEWNAIWHQNKAGALTIGTYEGDATIDLANKTTYNHGKTIFIGGAGNNTGAEASSNGTLNVGNATLDVENALYVGNSQKDITGILTVDGGAINVANDFYIGAWAGEGTLTANNATIKVTSGADGAVFAMGYRESAQGGDNATFADTATLTSSSITVGAAGGAKDITTIGRGKGISTLELKNGSTATFYDQTIVGELGSSNGSIVVDATSSLNLGTSTILGDQYGAIGTISVDGKLNTDGTITVGESGTGYLTVYEGGQLKAGFIVAGGEASGAGYVWNSGTLTTDSISIGTTGKGQLINNGTLNATNQIVVGSNGIETTLSSSGTINTPDLYIGDTTTGSASITAGTLNATNITLGRTATGNGSLEIVDGVTVKPITNLIVGYQGTGKLTTAADITATNTSVAGTASSISLDNAELVTSKLAIVGGTVNTKGGAFIDATQATVAAGGKLNIGSSAEIDDLLVTTGSSVSIGKANGNTSLDTVTKAVNDGTITIGEGAIWYTGGTTTNTGAIINNGLLEVHDSMSSLGIIDGTGAVDVTNGSTLSLAGAKSSMGTLSNAGTLNVNGPVTSTGAVTNTGALNMNGTLNAASVTNSGTISVQGESTIGGAIANTGTIDVNSRLTSADITNEGAVNVNAVLSAQDITNNKDITVQGLGRIDASTLGGDGTTTIKVDKNTASTTANTGAIIDLDNAAAGKIAVTIDLSNAAALVGKNVDFLKVGGTLSAIDHNDIKWTDNDGAVSADNIKWGDDYIKLSESTRTNEVTNSDGSIVTTTTTVTEKLEFKESTASSITDASSGMEFLRHETSETTNVSVDWSGVASVELEVKTETVAAVEEKVEETKMEVVTEVAAPDATEEQKQEIAIKNEANAAAAELVAKSQHVQKIEISAGVESSGSASATDEKKTQVIVGNDTTTEGTGSLSVQSVVVNQVTKFSDPNVADKKETIATSGLSLVFEGETKHEGTGKDEDGKNKAQLGFEKDTKEGKVKLDKSEDVVTEVKKVDIVQVKEDAKVEIKNIDMHATHALTIGSENSAKKATLVLDSVNFHVGGETDVNVLHMVEVKKYDGDGNVMLDANGNEITEMKPVETEAHLTTKSTITNAEVQMLGNTVLKFEQIDFGSTDEKLAAAGMNREDIEKLHGNTTIKDCNIELTGGDAQLGESDYTDDNGKHHKFQTIALEDTHVKGSGKIKNAKMSGNGSFTVGSSPGQVLASELEVNVPINFYMITTSPEWDNHEEGSKLTTNYTTGSISQLVVDKAVTINGAAGVLYQEWDGTLGAYVDCADQDAARRYIGSKITEDTVITFITGDTSQLTLGENFEVLYETLPILNDDLEWDWDTLFTNGVITVIGEELEEPSRIANTLVSAGDTVLNFGRLSMGQAQLRKPGTTRTWGSAIANFDSVDSSETTNGYDSDTWGAAVGVDHAFAKNTVVGLAFGRTYGENTPEFGTDHYDAGSIDQDATMVGLYGVHQFRTKGLLNDVKLNAFAAYGWFENESTRTNLRKGNKATAEWDSNAWVLSASLSRDITTDNGIVFTPYVGVEYTKATMDDFVEKGRTYDATYTADKDYSNLSVKVGVDVSTTIGSLTPYAGIAYINDVDRDAPVVTATGKRDSWDAKGALPGRSAVQLKVGANWQLTESWDLNASYTAEIRDKATEHNANVGVGYTF